MFDQGDYVMYPNHGVCTVNEISEKVICKIKKNYYILNPINEANSTIMTPVDNENVNMRALISYDEAREILESVPNIDINMTWIQDRNARNFEYRKIVKEINSKALAEVICILTIKKSQILSLDKKFSEADDKILTSAKKLLFSELSVTLGVSLDVITNEFNKKVNLENLPS